MTNKNKIYGTVDRIEGRIAIILVGDEGETVEASKTLLPEKAQEGDLISVTFELKDRKTKEEKEKAQILIRKLSS